MPDSSPDSGQPPRGASIVVAGLLLAALALVVLYTSRRAFLSPLALVVVAAIGVAALLLQLRLRPDFATASARSSSVRGSMWINALGVVLAVGAVLADVFRLDATILLIAALGAVVAFALSGIVVLNALRKRRI